MIRTFIEIPAFSRKVESEGGHELLLAIQEELLEGPESGTVIPGGAGLRKMRIADSSRGKGKRGGYRVIYLDIPEAGTTILLGLYGKGERKDISSGEKRMLREVANVLKREAKANAKN